MLRHLTQFARSCYTTVLPTFMLDLVTSKRDQELRRHFHKNIKSLDILLCKTLSFCQFLSRPSDNSFAEGRNSLANSNFKFDPSEGVQIRLESKQLPRDKICLSLHNKTSCVYFECNVLNSLSSEKKRYCYHEEHNLDVSLEILINNSTEKEKFRAIYTGKKLRRNHALVAGAVRVRHRNFNLRFSKITSLL